MILQLLRFLAKIPPNFDQMGILSWALPSLESWHHSGTVSGHWCPRLLAGCRWEIHPKHPSPSWSPPCFGRATGCWGNSAVAHPGAAMGRRAIIPWPRTCHPQEEWLPLLVSPAYRTEPGTRGGTRGLAKLLVAPGWVSELQGIGPAM